MGQSQGDVRRLLEQAIRIPQKQRESGWYEKVSLDDYQTKVVSEAVTRLEQLNRTIDRYGTELRTLDGRASLVQPQLPIALGYADDLTAVRFTSAERGIAIGKGIELVTDDGGETWTVRSQQAARSQIQQSSSAVPVSAEQLTASDLESAASAYTLVDASRLYRQGRLLLATGSRIGTTPRHWPTPLYWLATLLVLVFLTISIRRAPPPPAPAQASIADRAISDRPLDDPRQDVLNLNEVAVGLSRYLRNENTTAPLTCAVTGPWGSGKSSVLNLLSRDLKRSGFRPVRFNAWHQRAEDEIFSALLQSLREYAIPSALSLAGIRYRWRLLSMRARKQPRLALLLIGVSLFGLAYLTQFPPAEIWAEFQQSNYDLFEVLQQFSPALTAVVGVIGFMSGTKTRFGLRDAWGRLFGLLSLRTPKEAEKLGQRERFKREFRAITEALKPAALVIMIDDLDRCQPKQIMETLKTVNFLADCGDCFLVLGMAREMIERAIADQYDDLLSQADIDEAEADVDPKKLRRDFARQYLEKMVNIEVPVPLFTPESASLLLQQSHDIPANTSDSWWQRVNTKAIAFVTLVVFFAVAGALYGHNHAQAKKLAAQQAAQQAALETKKTQSPSTTDTAGDEYSSNSRRSSGPRSSETDNPEKTKSHKPFALQPAKTADRQPLWLLLIVPVLLLAFAALVAFAVRRGGSLVATTEDSDEFQGGLALWAPAIVGMHKSPRAVKRFVNKLRFLAMRQRVANEQRLTEEQIISLAVLRDWAQRQFDGNAASGLAAARTDKQPIPEALSRALKSQLSMLDEKAAAEFDAMASGVYVRR